MKLALLTKTLLLLFLFCSPCLELSAQQLKGKLGYVIDGDSFYIKLDNGRTIRVRISGIDSPEDEQFGGKESAAFLTELLKEQELLLTPDDHDHLGRMVAKINVDHKDVAEEMIRNGHAWHYKKYSNDLILDKLEKEARDARRGLWKENNPTPPWVHRDQKTAQAKPAQ